MSHDGCMIQIRELTRRFGETLALDSLSFEVKPGTVTGFLGPNGAGKTTTMRILLGLDSATSGEALIGGQRFQASTAPMRLVGAHLDVRSAHPGRTAYQHLRALSLTHRIRPSRVDEALEEVGLSEVAGKRVGGFSLGMRQRLGIASAILGDPQVFVFDEPVNGLDPDGVIWFRELVRAWAGEGRTVFLSSHLLNELEQTVDHVVVIGRGKKLLDAPLSNLTASMPTAATRAVTPSAERLAALFAGRAQVRGDEVIIDRASPSEVGRAAHESDIELHELAAVSASLEEAYRTLTENTVDFRAAR